MEAPTPVEVEQVPVEQPEAVKAPEPVVTEQVPVEQPEAVKAPEPVVTEQVPVEQTEAIKSPAPVAVEVTTPDGKPGLVREDDKAPMFVTPLQTAEVYFLFAISHRFTRVFADNEN